MPDWDDKEQAGSIAAATSSSRERETITRCCFDAGLASTTLAQHQNNTGGAGIIRSRASVPGGPLPRQAGQPCERVPAVPPPYLYMRRDPARPHKANSRVQSILHVKYLRVCDLRAAPVFSGVEVTPPGRKGLAPGEQETQLVCRLTS